MKVVIANKEKGRSYQVEIDENKSKALYGLKIGQEFDGSIVNLTGYKLKITGGSDKDGFPMRPDVHGPERKRILVSAGPGIRKKKKGIRRKKTVRGNIISESIAQINTIITKKGEKTIEELLGIKEEKKEGEENQKEESNTA